MSKYYVYIYTAEVYLEWVSPPQIIAFVGYSGHAVLRRESTAACLLGLRVQIPPAAWMSISCECSVL